MKPHFLPRVALTLAAALCMPLAAHAATEFFEHGGEPAFHSSFLEHSKGETFVADFHAGPSYRDITDFGHSSKGGEWGGGSWGDHGKSWCDPVTAVPEPGTIPIMLSGLALVGLVVARRRGAM